MPATLEQIGSRALSSAATVQASYDIARLCIENGIPGDFVECGVFAGVQCAAMAKAIMDTGARGRKVHLFDSFQGIPKAGVFDNDLRPLVGESDGTLESSGVSVQTVANVKRHMELWQIDQSLLVWHPGWFQDTLPKAVESIGQIAVLRLDGDLYESTYVCIQNLYPKIAVGGWCIVDDWNLDGCRKAVTDLLGSPAPIYFQRQQ